MSEGLNINIDKILGKEISNIASELIPKEELEKVAKEALCSLMKNDNDNRYYNTRNESKLDRMVKNKLLELIGDYVTDIINTDDFKEKTKIMAKEVIDESQQKTKEKMVELISDKLAGVTVDSMGYLRNEFQTLIREVLHGDRGY